MSFNNDHIYICKHLLNFFHLLNIYFWKKRNWNFLANILYELLLSVLIALLSMSCFELNCKQLYRKDLEKQEKGTTGVKKVRRKSQFPSLNPLNMDCVFRSLVYTKTKFPSHKTTMNSVCLCDVPTQLRCSQLQGLTNLFFFPSVQRQKDRSQWKLFCLNLFFSVTLPF